MRYKFHQVVIGSVDYRNRILWVKFRGKIRRLIVRKNHIRKFLPKQRIALVEQDGVITGINKRDISEIFCEYPLLNPIDLRYLDVKDLKIHD